MGRSVWAETKRSMGVCAAQPAFGSAAGRAEQAAERANSVPRLVAILAGIHGLCAQHSGHAGGATAGQTTEMVERGEWFVFVMDVSGNSDEEAKNIFR